MTHFSEQETNRKEKGPADKDWERTVTVLELLARKVMINLIAQQVNLSEKQVRNLRDRATRYPASLVAKLEPEVQDYLIQRRPKLKAELEEFRHRQAESMPRREVSATELAKAKHWEELARTAEKFITIWTQYLDAGTLIKGYIVDIDSHEFEQFALENGYMAERLLNHLKAEFPSEFERITHWKDLVKDPLPKGCLSKLLLVAKRRTFGGICDLCQGLS